jgi:hypothetical protein
MEGGIVEHGPMKMDDDYGQGLQMLYWDNCVQAAPLTENERYEEKLSPRIRAAALARMHDGEEKHRATEAHDFWRDNFRYKKRRNPVA